MVHLDSKQFRKVFQVRHGMNVSMVELYSWIKISSIVTPLINVHMSSMGFESFIRLDCESGGWQDPGNSRQMLSAVGALHSAN